MLSARSGLTAIGYTGVCGKGAGKRRLGWLRSTGHDSPGGTRPVFASRVSVSVLPGFGPNTLVNSLNPWRSYATEYPPRSVAISGSPSSVRSQPWSTCGRHATPTFGATLFQSVLYPDRPVSNCSKMGVCPPVEPGLKKLHEL